MWKFQLYDNYSVVYPIDEWHLHDKVVWGMGDKVKSDCPCGTRVEIENGHPIIIHGSFDGREGVEWAKELLQL